jgi:hypothetical protein
LVELFDLDHFNHFLTPKLLQLPKKFSFLKLKMYFNIDIDTTTRGCLEPD